jgi:hypothetical protein
MQVSLYVVGDPNRIGHFLNGGVRVYAFPLAPVEDIEGERAHRLGLPGQLVAVHRAPPRGSRVRLRKCPADSAIASRRSVARPGPRGWRGRRSAHSRSVLVVGRSRVSTLSCCMGVDPFLLLGRGDRLSEDGRHAPFLLVGSDGGGEEGVRVDHVVLPLEGRGRFLRRWVKR